MNYPAIAGRELVTHKGFGFTTKLYLFKSYLDHIGPKEKAINLLKDTLSEHPEIMDKPHLFAIAGPYGFLSEGKPVEGIDIFPARLREEGDWKGEIMYDGWTLENGIRIPKEKGVSCGTGFRVIADEEALRLTTDNLTEYLEKWPEGLEAL